MSGENARIVDKRSTVVTDGSSTFAEKQYVISGHARKRDKTCVRKKIW